MAVSIATVDAGSVPGRRVLGMSVVEDDETWSVVAVVDGHEDPVVVQSGHPDEETAEAAVQVLTEELAAEGDLFAPLPGALDSRTNLVTCWSGVAEVGSFDSPGARTCTVTWPPGWAAALSEIVGTEMVPAHLFSFQATARGTTTQLDHLTVRGMVGFHSVRVTCDDEIDSGALVDVTMFLHGSTPI